MSTTTATLPVHGHSLFAAVSKMVAALFAAPKATTRVKPATAPASVAATAVAASTDTGPNLWRLYRMSAGIESVNPKLFNDRSLKD